MRGYDIMAEFKTIAPQEIADNPFKLIGDDCPCFVPREKITPHDAVRFLLRFGGVPILAHPLQYKMSETELDALVASLTGHANRTWIWAPATDICMCRTRSCRPSGSAL